MKSSLALLFSACALLAQNNLVFENDSVRVLKVTSPPHQKTRMHQHKVNRVMIYLQPGKQTIASQDGTSKTLVWKAGDS